MKFKKKATGFLIVLVALLTIISLSGINLSLFNKESVEGDNNLNNDSTTMDKNYLTTIDGKRIAFDLYEKENPLGWLVLVHMMPSTKESWMDLAKEFQSLGYESVAIDLRGHGESDGGPDGYQNFSDQQHQESILDLEAAVNYLIKNRSATSDKISLIGASIGANLSLRYLSEHPEFKKAVLLSAGLNYRGLETESLVKKLKNNQAVFFITSKDDGDNAVESQQLYEAIPIMVKKDIRAYEKGGHGTVILENQPELLTLISNFLQ